MKFGSRVFEVDFISLRILDLLQNDCKMPLAAIGERVGLSAASVVERIKKLEDGGFIQGYVAVLDARKLGKDVTAFIGVSAVHTVSIETLEKHMATIPDVLEIHHVTGGYKFMLKVKTENTASLESLLRQILSIEGITNTETMVVLSTHTERWRIPLRTEEAALPKASKRGQRSCANGEGNTPPAGPCNDGTE